MRKSLLAASTLFALVGCMPPVPAPGSLETIRSYQLNTEHSAGIGEPIFDVQVVVAQEGFEAIIDHHPRLGSNWDNTPIEQGDFFPLLERATEEGLSVALVKGLRVAVQADGVAQGPRSAIGSAIGVWPDEPLFRPATRTAPRGDSFRAQLLYSGLDGSTVRAAYREFVGDFARPAFSQELQYDLAADSTIAYRSVQIRVISATNSTIRYQVVDDDGLAWLPR